MFLKMLPDGLKLCANGVDVVATSWTVYELHGHARAEGALSVLNIFWWPSHFESIRQHFKEYSENSFGVIGH